MKKNFFQGAGVVAMGLLLGSCVSQKKYDEAQRTIEQYRSDSAAWAAKYNSVQQNYSTLEQNNKQIQTRYDSINKTYMADQKRWQTYQGYYDQQRSTTQQIHQQLHTALNSTVIGEANVIANGNEVHVNLPENTFFTAGSSKLTSKGKEALQKMATVLKSNPELEIDIRTNMGNEKYSTSGRNATNVNSWSGDETRSDMDINSTDKKSTDKNMKTTDKKSSTTTKSTVKSTSTPEQKNSTMNTRVSASTKSSIAGKSKSENWSLHNARLNAIASELSNNGIHSVHVMTASGNRMVSNTNDDQSRSTSEQMNTSTASNTGRGYQVVISSSNDNWYDMMNENDKKASGTGANGNTNKSAGSTADRK